MTNHILEEFVDQILIDKSTIGDIKKWLGGGYLVGNSRVGESKLALRTHGRIKIDGIASEVISVCILEPYVAFTIKLMECCEFDEYEDLCMGTLYSNPRAAHGLYQRLFRSTPNDCFITEAKEAHKQALKSRFQSRH